MKASCRSVFEPMRRDEQDWGTEDGTGFERREIGGNNNHYCLIPLFIQRDGSSSQPSEGRCMHNFPDANIICMCARGILSIP